MSQPADPQALDKLLRELNIQPPGPASYEPVSRWSDKHVWRVDVGGEPWAIIRYLSGSSTQFPDQWRHLRLSEALHQARVGPRVLGIIPESKALNGRAAIVEAALRPISRGELEGRVLEAIALFTRLHGDPTLMEILSEEVTEADRVRFRPLNNLFQETRKQWFDVIMPRWLVMRLEEINDLSPMVGELLENLMRMRALIRAGEIGIVVPAHNDVHHNNFVINRRGALRMIDFEELSLNNPVADLGVFLTWYVDKDRHREVLAGYPLAEPRAVWERMRVWVPLRYVGIAAHWAARLTQAKDALAWVFAADSVDEWLRGACELVFDGVIPPDMDQTLSSVRASLRARSLI